MTHPGITREVDFNQAQEKGGVEFQEGPPRICIRLLAFLTDLSET